MAFACACGCAGSADSGMSILSVIPEEDHFHLSASAPDGGYCLEREYSWECTTGQAEVVFDSLADTSGSIRMIVFDAAGLTVYERTCVDPGNLFMREDTYTGLAGSWTAAVQISGFRGTVTIAATAK